MKYSFLLFILLFVWIFFPSELLAQGCSQCRLLAEQGSEIDENSFGSNINLGILYLMAVPYLLLIFLFRKKIIRLFSRFIAKGNQS